ncbi:hypothetical protein WMF31_10700 [Sorangium sp. So ce1036]|uniref:hypothetical protein n=1 Tax=Sorangium sp. So ce1036 TaxID=3133328 RepID=UPI003F02D005
MRTSGRADHEIAAGHAEAATTNSLEQVREILCGAQLRELARRLMHTDAQVAAQAEELRGEARRRLDVLETHVRKEIEALSTSFEAHRSADACALGNVARESREALRLFEQRIQRLEELVVRTQREFRQLLLEQSKSFLDETQRTRDELSAALARELAGAWEESSGVIAPEAPTSERVEAERHQKTERSSDEAA